MTDKEKIVKYLDYKGISKNKFYSKTGLSVGFLDSGSSLGVDKLRIIIDNYHDFNPGWLLTDKEEMLKQPNTLLNEPIAHYRLKTDHIQEDQNIPLYNHEAAAGLVHLINNTEDVIDYIRIPNLPKCDGAIFIKGDSMYPLLKSGDIVLFKIQQNVNDGVIWGEMYIVSAFIGGEDTTLVKYIQKSDEGKQYFKLVSQNPHHSPIDILIENIRSIALVKASVRINSMS